MRVDPSHYRDLPANRHSIGAGALLLPTKTPIIVGGATSLDFVVEQGGSADTVVLVFGVRRVETLGGALDVVEGVFLDEDGPGFHPTWDVEQLLAEVDRGGWTVIPTDVVLREWRERVEERMNL